MASNSILQRKTPITSRAEYLELVRTHHPDHGGSNEAMAHINVLYSDDYVPPNQVAIGKLRYNYVSVSNNIYLGSNSALFYPLPVPFTEPKYSFPDNKVKMEMLKYLPIYLRSSPEFALISTRGLYHLPSVLDKIKGTPHASWIISSLYNLLCYLEWADLTHNDIQVDNIWIDPAAHSAHLLGGWWWSVPHGTRLTRLPRRSLPAPKDKMASHNVDLRLIKQLGLELMGDRTGMSLTKSEKVSLLRQPTSGSAITDYKAWMASLGQRKFVELKL